MRGIDIRKICDYPEFAEKAVFWFSEKWRIPTEVYQKSVEEYISGKNDIPQWYIVLDHNQNIIAGAGIIENDFHDRRDLTPNLCALFVEENYRGKGIAGTILDFAREEMGKMNVERLYLVTEHTEFYERCGWTFLTMVNDDGHIPIRMYTAPTYRDIHTTYQ